MATAVRISERLVDEAKRFGRIDHRSLAGQIEHWAQMGKCVEETNWITERRLNTHSDRHL
ncbi:MAG: hypothetical protein NT010_05360 [Proteobacteria bacterium]|nr:hypothetical protein [Pseudomonadota bacterium]